MNQAQVKMTKSVVALSAMLILFPAAGMAQLTQPEMAAIESAENVDIAFSEPSKLLVQSVDTENRRIQLAGRWYRFPEQRASTNQAALAVDDLEMGMEIFVQTDGTEPSSDHEPLILDFWVE
jgi:hypothetical protein